MCRRAAHSACYGNFTGSPADESATALDAVVNATSGVDVELTRAYGTAVMQISHDLSMVARYTDRASVLEAARVVEEGPRDAFMDQPTNGATRRLFSAIPDFVPIEGGGVLLQRRFDESAQPTRGTPGR